MFDRGSGWIISPGGVWNLEINHGAWSFEVLFGFLLQCMVDCVGYERHVDQCIVYALYAAVAGWNFVECEFFKEFI